jgi:hypothetical protein
MHAATASAVPVSRKKLWAGRILTALPALMLLLSAGMKLAQLPPVLEEFTRLGYAESAVVPIGILEIACAVLYLIPRTSVLGAIMVTAYLGGAVATHARIGDPWFGPVILGVLAWIGLGLREDRLRSLLPLRS